MVADTKYQRLREEAQPIMYGAFAQEREINSGARVVIRTTGAPFDSRNAIVQAIAGVHKDIAVDLKRLDEDLGANVLQERLVATLSGFFGGLALLLAALGLYGVMSYTVTRRRNEIGIRMALGAEPRKVIGLVLRNVAVITIVGPDRRRRRHRSAPAASSTRCSTISPPATDDDRRHGDHARGGGGDCRLSAGSAGGPHRSDGGAARGMM